MSHTETLMARDGHTFSTYFANPAGRARGALIIVQEIFGITPHIRRLADAYAAEGYLVLAPALFDRARRDVQLGDSPPEMQQAMGLRKQIENGKALLDIAAACAVARHVGKVAVIGYCWGGMLAWLAAGTLPIDAAVCYYGGGIAAQLAQLPKCPTLLHFGARDQHISAVDVEQIRAAYPAGEYFIYEAGHAFNNDDRATFDAAAATLARTRTLEFLTRTLK